MNNIKIKCDRCGNAVNGTIDENADGAITTGGFYDVTKGGWKKYRRGKEESICDNCMFSDPKYIAIYGDLKAKKL